MAGYMDADVADRTKGLDLTVRFQAEIQAYALLGEVLERDPHVLPASGL